MRQGFFKFVVVCFMWQSSIAVPCSAVIRGLQTLQVEDADVADSKVDLFKQAIDQIKDHDDLIMEAFKETHDGWSSDEVVLQDRLNRGFLAACQEKLAKTGVVDASPAALNWRLLALRKAGKLKVKATKRTSNRTKSTDDSMVQDVAEIAALAEIAMRSMQDKSKLSSDRIMTDPELRSQFDAIVVKLNPKADLYLTRKAAFQLRKTRRLRPELISPHPGVYIFRDQTGYLYIGQTENLRKRMAEHLAESHNVSLARYLKSARGATVELHSFDPKSRAKEVRVRRAYESELIRSRNPRFNVLP